VAADAGREEIVKAHRRLIQKVHLIAAAAMRWPPR